MGLAVTVRVGEGEAEAVGLGELVALGELLGGTVLGTTVSTTTGGAASPAVSCTAPTVPPTAMATPTAAVAAMPAGEEKKRVRVCLPATGVVLPSIEQIGSDRNERSTSEVNVIMVVWPELQ